MNEHDDSQLRLLLNDLPRGIDPARDLWPGVEARVAAPVRRRRVPAAAIAAGVAALATLTVFFAAPPDGEGSGSGARLERAYQQVDVAYRPLREASLQRYRAGAQQLDPQLRRVIDVNLAVIDGALAEIRAALASRPDDAALRQMLQQTYEQQLAIIDAVTPRPAPADQTHYRGAL